MSTSVTVNSSTYSVPANRETGWGTPTSALLVALAANAGLDFTKAVFVAKQGAAGNSGMSPSKPKATFTTAMAVAAALTPSSSNRIAIVCLDAGIYTESVACAQYVDVYAPLASITGIVTLADDMTFTAYSVNNTGSICVRKTSGTGTADLDVKLLSDATGTAISMSATSGTINARVNKILSTTSWSIAASSTLNMFYNSATGSPSVAGTANVLSSSATGIANVVLADGSVSMTGNLTLASGIGINFNGKVLTVDTDGNVVVT